MTVNLPVLLHHQLQYLVLWEHYILTQGLLIFPFIISRVKIKDTQEDTRTLYITI